MLPVGIFALQSDGSVFRDAALFLQTRHDGRDGGVLRTRFRRDRLAVSGCGRAASRILRQRRKIGEKGGIGG